MNKVGGGDKDVDLVVDWFNLNRNTFDWHEVKKGAN